MTDAAKAVETKPAFETPRYREHRIIAFYLGEGVQNARIEIWNSDAKVHEFFYPAYKIWNVYAHMNEAIDGYLSRLPAQVEDTRVEKEGKSLDLEECAYCHKSLFVGDDVEYVQQGGIRCCTLQHLRKFQNKGPKPVVAPQTMQENRKDLHAQPKSESSMVEDQEGFASATDWTNEAMHLLDLYVRGFKPVDVARVLVDKWRIHHPEAFDRNPVYTDEQLLAFSAEEEVKLPELDEIELAKELKWVAENVWWKLESSDLEAVQGNLAMLHIRERQLIEARKEIARLQSEKVAQARNWEQKVNYGSDRIHNQRSEIVRIEALLKSKEERILDLEAELAAEREKTAKLEKQIYVWNVEAATCCAGSEFHNDPKRVFERLREQSRSIPRLLINAKKQARTKALREAAALVNSRARLEPSDYMDAVLKDAAMAILALENSGEKDIAKFVK